MCINFISCGFTKFIISSSFLVVFIGFSIIISYHLRTVSFTSFCIWIPFISFSSLIAVTRTSKTILYNTSESRHPCLFANPFSFSFLGIMLAMGLGHKWPLLCWGRFLLCWFSGDDYMAFIFQFVNMVYHTDWFANIKESLHPWNKAHLVMMYDLFNMLLDSVC